MEILFNIVIILTGIASLLSILTWFGYGNFHDFWSAISRPPRFLQRLKKDQVVKPQKPAQVTDSEDGVLAVYVSILRLMFAIALLPLWILLNIFDDES